MCLTNRVLSITLKAMIPDSHESEARVYRRGAISELPFASDFREEAIIMTPTLIIITCWVGDKHEFCTRDRNRNVGQFGPIYSIAVRERYTDKMIYRLKCARRARVSLLPTVLKVASPLISIFNTTYTNSRVHISVESSNKKRKR